MSTTDTQRRASRRRDTRKLFLWLAQVKADPELSPVAFMVAYEIGQHFNARHGGAAWPSSLTIASNIRISERSVIRAAKQLEQRGHLKIDPGKAGRGHSNQYFMVLHKGAASHPEPAAKPAPVQVSRRSRKPASVALKPAPAQENYLEPPMGDAKASPQEGERARSRALAFPASAPAPVGGALEEGKEAVDPFSVLWKDWSRKRSWPDSDVDEAAARRSFDLACREAQPDHITAAACTFLSAVDPRYVPTLSKWLLGRGWLKQPPERRQRNGNKVAMSPLSFDVAKQMERS